MKRTLMMAGLAGAMALTAATPAMAINKEWSAALGFLGGVMATRTMDYHRSQYGYGRGGCDRPYVVQQSYCPQPVVVQTYAPPPQVIVQQQPVVVQAPPSGHYEWREEQQWVEGSWKYEQIGCNTYRKTWCPGFYKTTRFQVWVQDGPCN